MIEATSNVDLITNYADKVCYVKSCLSESDYDLYDKQAFYIYQIITDNCQLIGMVGLLPLNSEKPIHVYRHEQVRPAKVNRLINSYQYKTEQKQPLLMLHKPSVKLSQFILAKTKQQPNHWLVNSNNEQHIIWRVSKHDEVKFLKSCYAEFDELFLADGHHRYEALSRMAERSGGMNNALTMLVDYESIDLHSFHRVAHDLDPAVYSNFLSNVRTKYQVEPIKLIDIHEVGSRQFLCYYQQQWYSLLRREDCDVDSTLTAIELNDSIIKPYLKIDQATDKRLQFISSAQGHTSLQAIVDGSPNSIALISSKLSKAEFLNASRDAECYLPLHTTCFSPKPAADMFVYRESVMQVVDAIRNSKSIAV